MEPVSQPAKLRFTEIISYYQVEDFNVFLSNSKASAADRAGLVVPGTVHPEPPCLCVLWGRGRLPPPIPVLQQSVPGDLTLSQRWSRAARISFSPLGFGSGPCGVLFTKDVLA